MNEKMNEHILSVRELTQKDINLIASYWVDSPGPYLQSMGVDLDKVPPREQLTAMLENQLHTPIENKRAYCIIWELNGKAIGHSNTNPTIFGEEAYMHLHMWQSETRNKGLGLQLLKLTIARFFEDLKLQKLVSEPFALNEAPNRTLQKAGFELVKEYVTTPGSLNFEQPVKRWELTRERFLALCR